MNTETYYKALVACAEPSWEEYQTTEYILSQIPAVYDVTRFSRTGCSALLKGTSGTTIGIRTDIDALTFYNDGKYYRHACGHNAHMAIVLALLNKMADRPLRHNYRFLFQPAEEAGNGAAYVTASGYIDDVDYLFGMHLRPSEELTRHQFSYGIQHGSNATVKIHITSCSGHAARPHLSQNAIGIAVQIYQAIKELSFKHEDRVLMNMTQLNTLNDNSNTIPGEAALTLDLRAATNEAMTDCLNKLEQLLQSIEHISYEVIDRVYAAQIDEDAARLLKLAITDVYGEDQAVPPIHTPGAEDFHMYTHLKPELKAVMLGIGCGMTEGLHHPEMTFDLSALDDSVEVMTALIERLESSELL